MYILRWCGRDPLESDYEGLSPIIFCLNNANIYADALGLTEYEMIDFHEVSIAPILGGDLPWISSYAETIKKKMNLKWINVSFDWSLRGSVRYERRKCCKGPLIGQEVTDTIWDGSLSGGVTVSIATNRSRQRCCWLQA